MLTLLEIKPSPDDQEKMTRLMTGVGFIIATIIILLIAVAILRKKYFSQEDEENSAPAGFGISELKELHAQGLLTDDEFATAKAKIITASHAAFMAPKKKSVQNAN